MADGNALNGLPVTDAELAALSGFTSRHIRTIAAAAKIGRNSYAAGPALKLIFEHMEGGGGLGKRLMAERIRKVAADATLAELELSLRRGDVALISEFQRAQEKRNAMTQARLMQVPGRAVLQIVGDCDESRIKAVLRTEIVQALTLAAEDEIQPEDIENEQESEN